MRDGHSNYPAPVTAEYSDELPPAAERDYAAFERDLTSSYDGRVRVLPPFEDDLKHRGTIPINSDKYFRVERVYLTSEVTASLGTQRVESIGFQPKPFLLHGREWSQRKVFFGNLNIAHQEQGISMPVAVKPFVPQAFPHATHEMGMYRYMDSLGIPTLQVVGMVAIQGASDKYKEPLTYVMTKEHRGLTTLDNVEWKTIDKEERWSRLRPAIDTMAHLHAKMLFHGDLEFKNVAYEEEERAFRVVDPEYMVSLRDVVTPFGNDPLERRRVVQKMSADFGKLFKSVTEMLLDKGTDERAAFESIAIHVYLPYAQEIARSDSPYVPVLLAAFDEVLEQKRQQAYGEWTGRSGY